jgi:prophage antirepressor-like protein
VQPAAPPALPPAQQPAPVKPRREAWAVYDDVCEALEQVGPQFVRADIVRALGYEPERSSLHRALLELRREGTIKLVEEGSGRVPSRWAKVAQTTAESVQGS